MSKKKHMYFSESERKRRKIATSFKSMCSRAIRRECKRTEKRGERERGGGERMRSKRHLKQ